MSLPPTLFAIALLHILTNAIDRAITTTSACPYYYEGLSNKNNQFVVI